MFIYFVTIFDFGYFLLELGKIMLSFLKDLFVFVVLGFSKCVFQHFTYQDLRIENIANLEH